MTSPGAVRPVSDDRADQQTSRTRALPLRRQWNLPWVAIGVLMVVGSGLVFTVWADGLSGTSAVLTLRRDIRGGEIVDRSDLATSQVRVGPGVSTVAAADQAQIVGQVAVTDLAAGTLVTPNLFTRANVVGPGRALVGVPLDPAAVPTQGLRAGDPVMVVEVLDAGAAAPPDPPSVWAATVFAVSRSLDELGNESITASLDVDIRDAPAVAVAGRDGAARLILIADLDEIPAAFLFADVITPEPEVAP